MITSFISKAYKSISKKRFLYLLIAGFQCFVGKDVYGQDYFFGTPIIKNFSTEDFHGGIQSWAITQDEREIIYVANNFGLLEFDGNTWNIYYVKNGTKVRSVYIGKEDRIYVGTQADFGYFHPDKVGILQYTSLADSLPDEFKNFDEVWRIFEEDNCIYFLTFKNIYCYTPGHPIKVIAPQNPLEFSFQVNNKIFSLEWGKGLSLIEKGKLKLVPGGEFFADQQIASILPYDEGKLLIFTIKNGLFLYNGNSTEPFPILQDQSLGKLIINQAIMLKDGSFAIGTQNNGLLIIDRAGKLLLHLTRDKGLFDQTVITLFQDAHENLWLGLNNGLSMAELSSPFSLIDENMGISGTGYAAIQVEDNLYLGTNNGLYSLNLKQEDKRFSLVPNSTGQVYQLKYIDGHLLMGHHNGPFYIQNDKAYPIGNEKGAWEYISVPGHANKIILGTYTGLGLMQSSAEKIELVKKYKGLNESSRVLEFDNEGNLWMAHGYKGIFKIKFKPNYEEIEKVDFYNSKNGFPSDQLINMEKINNTLIFPALTGIYKYDKPADKFIKFKKFDSLFMPDEHVIKMEEDILGNIYFISNRRVGRISFDKFDNAKVETKLFNKIKGMLNDDLSTIHVIDSKNIIFGAKKGFIHYNVTKIKKMQPFHTHITKVLNTSAGTDSLMCEGKMVLASSRPELAYGLNSLRFIYSSSFYESPEKTEYQFLLKNFDKDWSEWTTKVEKEYTNLPEGEYEFNVRAKNVYGKISDAESYSFVIQPPFYRSKIAYFIYSISGMFLFALTFFQVDKRFKKEKKLIMLKQERELHKKNSQIEKITTQSEEQIIKLKNDKLRSEIDHMNRELTSSTIHLINKNELLNNVKLGLSDIIKKKERGAHNDELKKIIKNIDQNINSDGDWKNFELHFNHVHENFTTRLLEKFPKLTPQEIKLSAYLRLNLSTKEIAHLLNISVRGVEISRYRLRKKLNLERTDNLTDFMLKF